MFFEGSEKKVEAIVSGVNLRGLGRIYWEDIVRECHGEIISHISGDELDAYLLSESSLLVWDNRVVMITCGQTVLLKSILKLIKDVGKQRILCLIFQRKNEYDQFRQKSSFSDDIKILLELIPGDAYRFGHLDGHHHFVFNLDRPYQPRDGDITSELLMYHIGGEAADILRSENFNQKREQLKKIRKILKVDTLDGFVIDDHLFYPYGYSMNGIKGGKYVTIHATPQAGFSYVSYETNLEISEGEYAGLLPRLIQRLLPDSFDLITFDGREDGRFNDGYFKWDHVKKRLSCGYYVQFFHYVSTHCDPREADTL